MENLHNTKTLPLANKRWRSFTDLDDDEKSDLVVKFENQHAGWVSKRLSDQSTCCDKVKRSASSALKRLIVKPDCPSGTTADQVRTVTSTAAAVVNVKVNVLTSRNNETVIVSKKPRLVVSNNANGFPKLDAANGCMAQSFITSNGKVPIHKSSMVSTV